MPARTALLSAYFFLGQLNLRGKSRELEQHDQLPDHIQLPARPPVTGTTREAMMIGVPSLAQRQNPQPRVVPRLIALRRKPRASKMGHALDGVSQVVNHNQGYPERCDPARSGESVRDKDGNEGMKI